MLIQFKRLHIHNFFSYIDSEIKLDNQGFCKVVGINNCNADNTSSNGAGKSSIWNALCYCLTGKLISGETVSKKDILNFNVEDNSDGYIELELYRDGDKYIIKRIFSPEPNIIIIKNNIDISGKGKKEGCEILNTELNINSNLLYYTVFLSTQRFNFCEKTASEKLNTLTDIFINKLEIEDIINNLANIVNSYKIQNENLLQKKIQISSIISITEKDKILSEKHLEEYSEENYNNLLNKLEEINQKILEIENKKPELTSQEEEYSKKYKLLYEEKVKYFQEINNKKYSEGQAYYKKSSEIELKQKEVKINLNHINEELNKFRNKKCPTCGQKISDEKISINLENKNKLDIELSQLNSLLESVNKKHLCYKEELSKLNTNNIDKEIIEVNSILTQIRKDLSDINIDIRENYIQKINLENNINIFNTHKEEIKNKVEEYETNLSKSKVDLIEIESQLIEVADNIKTISDLLKLTKKEFTNFLLENIITEINNELRKYALEIFNTEEVKLVLNNTNNNLNIFLQNKPYFLLSSGEKQKLNIIISLAIRKVYYIYINKKFNLIVLDEFLDSIDENSQSVIGNFLFNLLREDNVFLVSHNFNALNLAFDSEIIVEKDTEGNSKIINV